MSNDLLFKPRDFIYINQSKLDSYFSQLYGGLIQNMDISELDEDQTEKKKQIGVEAAGKFGIGKDSFKLLDFLINQLGSFDLSGKVKLSRDSNKLQKNSSTFSSHKTLEHFQYALFEESMRNLGYLINLNKFHSLKPKIQAGQIRENLKSSDFVIFKASTISVSDYRNASEFVKLFKRIIDLSVDFKLGELIDLNEQEENPVDSESLKRLATATVATIFNNGQYSLGLGEKFNSIVNGVYEFFNGDMIPHDILLRSELELGNGGHLVFESQLKDQFLFEDRTDLAYKYGFFEDAEWTIVGQITSTKNTKQPNVQNVFDESMDKIKTIISDPKDLNLNTTVKEIVKEIDQLTKKVGLLPLVDERNISLTPIAIFREPCQNNFFQ